MLNTKRVIFAAVVFASGITVAALSAKGPPPRQLRYEVDAQAHRAVPPGELAKWIVEGRRDFTVIDLRPKEQFEQGHIRSSVHCGHCHESREEGRQAVAGGDFVDLSKKLIVYTETGTERVELPKLLARNPNLWTLRGGWQGWKAEVLSKASLDGVVDDERKAELQRREAVRAFFAGERPTSGNTAVLPIAPIKRQNAHQPAAAREGC